MNVRMGCLLWCVATAAAARGSEVGLSFWYSGPLNDHFGPRPELMLSWDTNPLGPLLVRSTLRASGPIELRGAVIGHDDVRTLGTFVQVSPAVFVLGGWAFGPWRLAAGGGLSYHVRF